MYVELLGLPACGKSTVLHGVLTHFEGGDDVTCGVVTFIKDTDKALPGYVLNNAVPRALFRFDQFRETYPNCVRLIDEICVENRSAKALILGLAVSYQTFLSNPHSVQLAFVDEGFLHRVIFHLATSDDAEAMLDAFCAAMPVPDSIIFLRLPPEDSIDRAIARLTERNKGRNTSDWIKRRILIAHGDVATLTKRQALMDRASNQLELRGSKVIRLAADDSPDVIHTGAITGLAELL